MYGHASDDYYADQPVLVLKEDGPAGRITVCWKKSSEENATALLASNKGITAEWAGEFDEKTHLADVVVTPGKAGSYFLYFSNQLDDDKFQVMVIVR